MKASCRIRFQRILAFSVAIGLLALPVRAADDGFADIAAWRLHHFGSTDNTGTGANTADPDGDGVVNLIEYALMMNPQARGTSGLPIFGTTSEGLTLTYQRARADIDYVVESSVDLVNWSSDGVAQGSAGLGQVIAVAPFGSPSPVVLRLRVNEAISTVTGVRESDADALEFIVNTPGWADVHYRINGGAETTVRMTQSGGQNTFVLTGLEEGDTVEYAFTYLADGEEVVSGWATYTFQSNFDKYSYTPLYTAQTALEQDLQVWEGDTLYTYFSDRARDRHAREDQNATFKAYDHYISHYWENRITQVEIKDEPKYDGANIVGRKVTFRVRSPWKYDDGQAELRGFYRGIGTVAEYHNNKSMDEMVGYEEAVDGPFFTHFDLPAPTATTHYYTRVFDYNNKYGRQIQTGDRLEFELSQFLDFSTGNPEFVADPQPGRDNYYGTTFLYIVGKGLVPWYTVGVFGDASTEREDSYEIPEIAWLGGHTTLHYNYSDEPDNHFMQIATNLAPQNGEKFLNGRRLHHTDFGDGHHTEVDPESPMNPNDTNHSNPAFTEMVGKLGNHYINRSCVDCHVQNGRALPPETGSLLDRYAIQVGDANGAPHPRLGHILQPKAITSSPEARVYLASWEEVDGLRKPVYTFQGVTPETFSARIAPQLVGMGLLEAIAEEDIEALADPADLDGDGISGRMHIVTDPETGQPRLGRFGWKAGKASVRDQIASAYNTDMGVMTSVFPNPDKGSQQTVEASGSELDEEHLENHTAYISLLGVRPQRGYNDKATNLAGIDPWENEKQLFADLKCASCHTPSFQTSPYHPFAELRDQSIQPYTDLLLHDMGPGLADSLGEGDASGSEWRTPPLWGIGLTPGIAVQKIIDDRNVIRGEAYLHDGRARTLEEAILWHGGEAAASKAAYEALSASEKAALIAFLKSL